jgi:hypothetical protein
LKNFTDGGFGLFCGLIYDIKADFISLLGLSKFVCEAQGGKVFDLNDNGGCRDTFKTDIRKSFCCFICICRDKKRRRENN